MAVICQRVVILLKLCTDVIDKSLTFYLIPNLSHLEHLEYCYKVLNAKAKFWPSGNLEFAFSVFTLEKSCKSVVSPYIFTVSILFLILDTLRVQKNIDL